MAHRRMRLNPEGLANVAKETGMTALEGVGAGVLVAVAAVLAAKVEYSASTSPADAAKYRLALFSLISIVAGAAMQFGSGMIESLGKLMIALGVGIPTAAFVMGKAQDAMLPATASAQERAAANAALGGILVAATLPSAPVAPSAGMGFGTGYNWSLPAASYDPSSGMGFNSGVSNYYR